jgi:hypothetical protein
MHDDGSTFDASSLFLHDGKTHCQSGNNRGVKKDDDDSNKNLEYVQSFVHVLTMI